MKSHPRPHWLWLLLAVAAGVLLSRGWQSSRTPPATVPIEEGKTIDFSSGQPVIKDEAADRSAIQKAQREMDEAAANITFAPTKPQPASPPPQQPD
jgi:hypothetical protein